MDRSREAMQQVADMLSSLQGFIEEGGVLYAALLLLLIEGALLALFGRRARQPLAPLDGLLMTLPGACLLLAMLAAQHTSDWRAVACALTLAFVAHVGDLWRRTHAPPARSAAQ